MHIKYETQGETFIIQNATSLLEHLKSGVLSKESNVYDYIGGAYKRLFEVSEVRALGLDNDINAFLGYDQKVLHEEQKKHKRQVDSKKTVKIISLVLLSIGILIKLSFSIILIKNLYAISPGLSGAVIGRVIAFALIGVVLWRVIWNWVKKGGAGIALLLFSLIYMLVALRP